MDDQYQIHLLLHGYYAIKILLWSINSRYEVLDLVSSKIIQYESELDCQA